MTDGVERDPLQVGLEQLGDIYKQWSAMGHAARTGEVSSAEIRDIADTGARVVRTLVGLPGFADHALDTARRVADSDPRVLTYEVVVEGLTGDSDFIETRNKMARMLRMRAPIGRTAIGWALQQGLDLRTCGDVQEYFSQSGETPAHSFIIPEGAPSSHIEMTFTPGGVTLADQAAGQSRTAEYLAPRYVNRVVTHAEDGSEITTKDVRRLVTIRMLQEFQQQPDAPITGDRFHELVHEVMGTGPAPQEFSAMSRNIRSWWETRLHWNFIPIINESGGGSGKGKQTEFRLSLSMLPLQVTNREAEQK
jgi:hypothetical protein